MEKYPVDINIRDSKLEGILSVVYETKLMATNNLYDVVAYDNNQGPMRLLYDTWKCRSHIVISLRQPKSDVLPDELRAMYRLIGEFLRARPQFDSGVILSFRKGNWILSRMLIGIWQARLRVPSEVYKQEAKLVVQPRNIPPWNKRGQAGLTIETGVDQWESNKKREGDEQKTNLIAQGITNQTFLGDIPLAFFNTSPQRFELVWQIPTPRIGVVALSPADTDLEELYNFMSRVYTDIQNQLRQYNQNRNAVFDCHMCLHVRGQIESNVTCRQGQVLTLDEEITTNDNLVGYFQMAEDHYLWWLPQNLKQIWFDNFSQVDHVVGT